MKLDFFGIRATEAVIAFSLLSRLPVPHLSDRAFDNPARAAWAYGVVGGTLGGMAALMGWGLIQAGIPEIIAAGMALAVLMLSSGAMHEDGLADTADGLWGGHDRLRRLAIMKDSHIGTYGVLSLVIVTGTRWIAYALVLPVNPLAMIAVAALSRSMMPCLMVALPHARSSGLSHQVGRPSALNAAVSVGIASCLAALCSGAAVAALIVSAVATVILVGTISNRKIGGQTGDILGAAQQVSEVAMLLVLTGLLT